ncbi:MAG TPA: hypothetical protein VFB60_05240 [Ktedonobacteraceae bacterium]|nr:hypothetical protein [Ktedonobacteraceae bacterium]
MYHHHCRNYHIIRVMLWSFPYLLWQAFGHWSGFFVGVIVAVILTAMLDDLLCVSNCSTRWRSSPETELQPRYH